MKKKLTLPNKPEYFVNFESEQVTFTSKKKLAKFVSALIMSNHLIDSDMVNSITIGSYLTNKHDSNLGTLLNEL